VESPAVNRIPTHAATRATSKIPAKRFVIFISPSGLIKKAHFRLSTEIAIFFNGFGSLYPQDRKESTG
jgi:hypothetical protein